MDRQTVRQQTDRQTVRQTHRLTDRLADWHSDRQADRQTDIRACIHGPGIAVRMVTTASQDYTWGTTTCESHLKVRRACHFGAVLRTRLAVLQHEVRRVRKCTSTAAQLSLILWTSDCDQSPKQNRPTREALLGLRRVCCFGAGLVGEPQ